jgi:plastocyanin
VRFSGWKFPSNVVIHAGDTVRWVSEKFGDIHAIMLPGLLNLNLFGASDMPGQKDYVEHTFRDAGVFPYMCAIHKSQNMNGTIKVLPRATVTGEKPKLRLTFGVPGSHTYFTGQSGTVGQGGGDLLIDAGSAGDDTQKGGVLHVGKYADSVQVGRHLHANAGLTIAASSASAPTCNVANRGQLALRPNGGSSDSLWLW